MQNSRHSATDQATRITFLGTGTSHGIPMIACHCPVCTSDDDRDKRTRCSLHVQVPQGDIIIDTSPEFRLQCIANNVTNVDAVFFTHTHADHIFGLDDIRRFTHGKRPPIPCFASKTSLKSLKTVFSYAFAELDEYYSERPRLSAVTVEGPFELLGKTIIPLTLEHGRESILGYRIDNWAYCTDCSTIPPQTRRQLQNLDVLIIGGLRYTPHPTHFNVDQALAAIDQIKPKRAYLTHIAHEIMHADLEPKLPSGVHLSYDSLKLTSDA